MGRKLSAWLLLLPLLAVSIDAQVPEHGEEAQESEKNEEGVGLAVQAMLPLSCTLILAFVISSSMEACNITWIPESAVVILLGLGLGCIFVFVLGEYNFGEGNIIPVLGPPVVKQLSPAFGLFVWCSCPAKTAPVLNTLGLRRTQVGGVGFGRVPFSGLVCRETDRHTTTAARVP